MLSELPALVDSLFSNRMGGTSPRLSGEFTAAGSWSSLVDLEICSDHGGEDATLGDTLPVSSVEQDFPDDASTIAAKSKSTIKIQGQPNILVLEHSPEVNTLSRMLVQQCNSWTPLLIQHVLMSSVGGSYEMNSYTHI